MNYKKAIVDHDALKHAITGMANVYSRQLQGEFFHQEKEYFP